MNLIDLVKFFREGGSFEFFCKKHSLDLESEVVEVYMRKPFNINSEIFFFEIEKTEGNLEFQSDGIIYNNLFDFYYFLDVIKDSNNESYKELSNLELAKILLSYGINDC